MTGRPRGSADARSQIARGLLRFYLGLGGPIVAVVLFLGFGRIWWAIGWLIVWMGFAKIQERMGGR